MLTNRSQAAIVQRWRQEIEINLEAGDPPILGIGLGAAMFDGLSGARAFLAWQASRDDVAQPQIISGGADPFWLVIWLLPVSPQPSPLRSCSTPAPTAPRRSPASRFNLTSSKSPHRRPVSDLPTGFAPLFAPRIGARQRPPVRGAALDRCMCQSDVSCSSCRWSLFQRR
ncbi:MAG: hypothetical protein HC802_00260 [Caldilineaceae bacterium]|nr:hypothetical protein [Caldilineaceae bacterium]